MKKFFNKLWHNIKLFFAWLFSGRELIHLLVWLLQVFVIVWLILIGYTLAGGEVDEYDYNVVGVDTISMEWVADEYPKEWPIQDYIVSAAYEYDQNKSLMFDNNKKLLDNSYKLNLDYYDHHTTSVRGYQYNQYSIVVEVNVEVEAFTEYVIYFNNYFDNDTYVVNLEDYDMTTSTDIFFRGFNFSDNTDYNYNGLTFDYGDKGNSYFVSGRADSGGDLRMSFIFSTDGMPDNLDIEIMDQQNYSPDYLLNWVYNNYDIRVYSGSRSSFINDVTGGLMSYGYAAGYRFGYSMGQYEFENQDYQDGYAEGWNDSILENNEHWINTGYLKGYQEGYAVGKQDGYDIGYPEGQAAEFGFTSLLASVFVGVGSFLSINILPNISIGAIIAVPIVFGIIYFIIGRRKGD